MAGAVCECSASFSFGTAGVDDGMAGIVPSEGGVEASVFAGTVAFDAGASFTGVVCGDDIVGDALEDAACFGAASSAFFGLAPSRPISTTMLRSSRKALTSGVPTSVKTTATVSKSTSDSIDFKVGGSEALASAKSQFTC